MVEQHAAAKRRNAEAGTRPDPLEYWQSQDGPLPPVSTCEGDGDDRPLPSGWWLLPLLVLSAGAWVAIWVLLV